MRALCGLRVCVVSDGDAAGEDMGFMTLATEELEGLFGKIRAKHGSLASMFTDASCTGELYVTGFSMGGALAQIFSYMANLPSDPLKLHVNVAELYLFGSMPSAMTPLSNGQSADGCFKGTSYYNLVPAGVAAGYSAHTMRAALLRLTVAVPIHARLHACMHAHALSSL